MTNSIAWLFLLLAICTEVAGITSMKLSNGFTELEPSILIFIFYTLSFGFLYLSLKYLDVSFAYAIWSALGTVFIFIIGVWFFQEPLTYLKCASLLLIIIGVIGLKRA